jgi:hypothetical protein
MTRRNGDDDVWAPSAEFGDITIDRGKFASDPLDGATPHHCGLFHTDIITFIIFYTVFGYS